MWGVGCGVCQYCRGAMVCCLLCGASNASEMAKDRADTMRRCVCMWSEKGGLCAVWVRLRYYIMTRAHLHLRQRWAVVYRYGIGVAGRYGRILSCQMGCPTCERWHGGSAECPASWLPAHLAGSDRCYALVRGIA